MRRILSFLAFIAAFSSPAYAGIIFDPGGLVSGFRWDAAPQVFSGNERSLQGGLRFSVQGGSYQAYRDLFTWSAVPAVAAFQQAVEQAFGAWTSVDPATGLGTPLIFVSDFGTAVVGAAGFGGVNANGAEIDLFGQNSGNASRAGLTSLQPVFQTVTITSGVANYHDSATIAGVDIDINNNPGAVYTLDQFRRLLTHEIGHAIGVGDSDLGGNFIDDNFNAGNPAGTLTNSWANLVDPLDPTNSPGLARFNVPAASFTAAGVDLLMESNGLGVGATNPITNPVPLTNDEYGTRQFLYPMVTAVPEPSSVMLSVLASIGLIWRTKRRRSCSA